MGKGGTTGMILHEVTITYDGGAKIVFDKPVEMEFEVIRALPEWNEYFRPVRTTEDKMTIKMILTTEPTVTIYQKPSSIVEWV